MKNFNKIQNQPRDVNSKRKRISVDEEGKPLLKDNARKNSPPNFKTTRLKEENKKSEK